MRALASLFCLLAAGAWAAPAPVRFTMLPGQSSIAFEATNNGEKVTGQFTSFTAGIAFHPEALEASKAKVTVEMGKFKVSSSEAQATLDTEEWFNVAAFPQAVFETQSFKKMGDNRYEAASTLTIKGHAVPVTLLFTLHEFSDKAAHVTGETTLKRKTFQIGWDSTAAVADDVRVTIDLQVAKE
ncbi:MAG: YceI family protein [Alphaproteobacteria bacterium]|nr:YceI family protein [Alphaproteobacteria bacterium]